MKIVSITLGYIWITDEEVKAKLVAKRRATLEELRIEFHGTDDDLGRAPKFIVTDVQVTELLLAGEELKIDTEVKLNISHDVQDMVDMMRKVSEKLDNMPGGGEQYNAKCEVHMPGNALMTYNVTMLLEDSCTDELQNVIDKGWRIIAACPQPDKRRPDYILGRFDPTHNPGSNGAYRRYD